MASAAAWRSASAIAGLVASKLGELVWDEATLLWRFKDDMDDLKETAWEVEALMHDADSRSDHNQGQTMRVWMNKSKSAAYDIEDLLDEFEAIELVQQN
ncbi:hypothetical protein PR202_gb24178 [Eleusine coracana subsp. coracana]|uniref:Disease resistance N-terminal domain-containing protein n=1 Tax=Eleusine coracana subsp. coracana TaxID=191504 RepID=A0AAV5FKJ2_ELECO|nr:hypothetical protein QOZ80_5BG0445460 [Eleusine coracana subsp. coracana]GJN35403.1 hypothetical protein PR202_gb24178 [Eleusine coracana subsp. coracana]